MANICDICNMEFATPAALGSHKWKHREVKAKANSSEPVTIRLLVEQAQNNFSSQFKPYVCMECGKELRVKRVSIIYLQPYPGN